ncbi:hypothetical protein ACF0H5_018962 [Mactra antiquata]
MKAVSGDIVLELIRIISKPSFKREDNEIELVLPWLCKRSQLLSNQKKSVLVDIVKNCAFLSCYKDDIIIKQGERGDSYFEDFCFYVILRGSASIFIDPKMTGEGVSSEPSQSRRSDRKSKVKKPPKAPESEASVLSGMEVKQPSDMTNDQPEVEKENEAENEEHLEENESGTQLLKKPTKPLVPVDRNKFGKFIANYGVGGTFGELALVNQDAVRNASIIADEDTDMIVIDRDLFERSLKEEQETRYAEIRTFIDEHPFFKDMNTRFKKLLEMSIRKERYIFDTNIIRQGEPVVGLHFFVNGSANISIQPKKHVSQFPHLWPFEAGMDQIAIEFEHLREARRAAILRKYEDPSVWETKPEELVIRREQGYAAIEKKMKENHINLCSVQNREVLGDLEMLCNLGTYLQTVRCTSDTQCFVLDTKNFERLIGKKNNAQTMDIMREYVKSKLHTRMQMRNADLIPLLGYLHQKLTEQSLPPRKRVEPFKTSKSIPDVDEEMQHLLQYFRDGKEVVLIKPCVPGVVYYHELMQEKAKQRALQRKGSKVGGEIKLGSVYKSRQKRQPRSMLQIRESLKQMMEAEVIEMESKHFKKKKKNFRDTKSYKEEKARLKTKPKSPKTQIEMSNGHPFGSDTNINKISENETENLNNTETNGFDSNSNGLGTVENLPKSTPPVFVTEMAKESEIKLPAIREENTQEDLLSNVNAETVRDEDNNKTEDNTQNTERSSKQSTRATPMTNARATPTTDRSQGNTPKKAKKGKQSPQNSTLPYIEKRGKSTTPDSSKMEKRGKSVTPDPSKMEKRSKSKTPDAQQLDVPDSGTQGPIPKLPILGASQTSLNQDSEVSSHWETAITFVNQRVQDRLKHALLEEETSYKDFETSEPSLSFLEHKIQAFHIKYGKGDKTKNLPPLKRYKLDDDDRATPLKPKPGGKVWVKRQLCKFNDSKYAVKDHKHIRYQMVSSIPEFDRVQKSRVVVQQFLKSADFSN